MMAQSAWEHARELIGPCLNLLPAGKKIEIENFVYDGSAVQFSYKTVAQKDGLEELQIVEAHFKQERERVSENLEALALITERRTYFILEDAIYEEPPTFRRIFPDFSYCWKKSFKDGKVIGILDFFRIDFSYDDFINYEGEGLPVTLKNGNPKLFSNLPANLQGVDSFLATPIIREIDFERSARELLRRFKLQEFARACGAIKKITGA